MSGVWEEAKKHLAGGVDSPVRAFKAVGGEPVFMAEGRGPFLYDHRGRRYLDYCLSWGAILFGHADPQTVRAVRTQAAKGTGFGTATEYETALAREIKKAFPRMERMRFTSSGTEAVMSAIRLARGVTRRSRIVKFEGCYHGHADGLLVKAGSGLATFGAPDSDGVPSEVASLTTVLPYNDVAAVRRVLKKKDTACVIVEPVAGNMGVVPATAEFLAALREETRRGGSLLIFDEVISGYRVAYGGAAKRYGVSPDLTTLGKIIGGGLPVGAFGGSASLMKALSPTGKVYQAGTLSGNPLSMAAGLSVLSRLSEKTYATLEARTAPFLARAGEILREKNAVIQNVGSMFTVFFGVDRVRDFGDVRRADGKEYARFFHHLLRRGVYFPPSAFEACFLSLSHGAAELDRTLGVFEEYSAGWKRKSNSYRLSR
ncbi:MAG: glutamate-1-semialdehyde 2,1-aminomutase [Candidatus Omnitrophica bacterium]|nr:glutamate-1-semialdehyde 2,1-aminomutase [Candidatus Omnitrophota bacterium]